MSAFTQTSAQPLQTWLPKLASVLLVVAIAYILSQTIWRFFDSGAASNTPAAAPNIIKPKAPSRAQQQASSIAALQIFGKANVQNGSQVISAPETKLNLQLRGILAIGEKDGLAIIAASSGKEDVYGIGKRLPGNATLKAVYADRVLLESSRGLETLYLPKDKELFSFSADESSTASRGPAAVGAVPDLSPESLSEYRRQFIRNPASLAEIAQVAPAQVNGSLQGYKITPQRDDPLFGALGLESGDIVTSINGISLTKPENGIKALRDLMKAKQLNVTVLRNGAETQLQHSFSN